MDRLRDHAGLSLRSPIVQAVLGPCATPGLAAAVSNAGALGCVTVDGLRPAAASRLFDRVLARTRRPVLVAFTADWERDEVLDAAFERGFRHFQVFWWNGERLIRRIHAGGGLAFAQVGTEGQAREALERGADALVVQGNEAGGPVRSPIPARDLTGRIRSLAGDRIPLIAGGGLADRADVAEILRCGADAALLGTRFLLTEEAGATARDKARLVRARPEDLLLDTRLVGPWPCAPRRRLATAFDEDRSGLFAGLGVGRMRSVLPAAEVVRHLTPRGA